MAITKFVPEIWAATLLSTLEKSLVYAGAPCVNRDYEGEIANQGDTVRVSSFGSPSIVDYSKDTDLTIETLTDSELVLTIDQAKAFAFEVDDIDKRQMVNGGAAMTEAAKQAAYGLRDVADQFVAKKMILGASNALGVIDATTATNVYDKLIVPMRTKLHKANIPTEGRFMVLDPYVTEKLLLDSRFIKVNESGSDAAMQNGLIGRIGGFNIMESNNAPVSNRSITATVTVATTAKTLTATAGTFSQGCLLYTSPSPRDKRQSRMPSSA